MRVLKTVFKKTNRHSWALALIAASAFAFGQTSAAPEATADGPSGAMTFKKVFTNLPGDQKTIWLSPFRLRAGDAAWAGPFAASTGLMLAGDRRFMEREHSSADAIRLSKRLSDGGLASLAGVPAFLYLWGSANHLPRARETGLLTGEAFLNSLIVGEALKAAFGRERPTATGGRGRFFTNFGDGSFPSEHAMLSWGAASVIAHEYPGVVSQMLAYGTAAAVSVGRVTGRKHFPADVLAGGALGWMIGRQMYRAHHDRELDDGEYGRFVSDGSWAGAEQTGTVYVPMDSWVYGALDRLAALGMIDTATEGLRPWTRSECARLVKEAGEAIGPDAKAGVAPPLYADLAREFAAEIEGPGGRPAARVEEVYARAGYISGRPLADDFHFAKSVINDFGRPFGQGANAVTGASGRATVGPLAFYARGEYQHAGTLAAAGPAAEQAITALEGLPFAPPQRTGSLDRFRVLDAYVSYKFRNAAVSFGKQTLWWGPGGDGPFLAGNNAEPMPMLRISSASPFRLPWIFGLMGATRVEFFWGRPAGQQFVALFDGAGNRMVTGPPLSPPPMVDGEKISFKPTRNLEFGFGVTTIFSGPGFPLTLHTLLRSYSPGNTTPGEANDPGDRRSAFDWSYRVPGLRNWLTFYGDSFTEDEFSPISFPRKSNFRAGLYLPRLPRLPKFDLRVEGIYTDIPSLDGVGVAYANGHYLSGYTNDGQIIGNAIGREGRGVSVWAAWRYSAQSGVELRYRGQRVNPLFLEGGNLRDFEARATFAKAGGLVFSGTAKYEHWNFPLLAPGAQSNVSGGLQVSYRP